MKRNDIRMIACDLDGTLLRGDKSISEETAATLALLKLRGIKIALATARSTSAGARAELLSAADAAVNNNGALARLGEEVIFRRLIPADVADCLITACVSHPDVEMITVTGEGFSYTNGEPQEWGTDYAHYKKRCDFSTPMRRECFKITALCPNPAVIEEIAGSFPECTVLEYTGERFYCFTHREATKWNGLAAIADCLGIAPEHIAAFGDDVNDIEMLRRCGVGVAMGNAVGAVKAIADQVCLSNEEDGIARWIAENLL